MAKVAWQIDAADRVVVISVSSELENHDLLDLVEAFEQSTELKSGFSLLFDLREASGEKVTSVGVRALADRSLPVPPDSRVAVVVPSDLGFGMARMFEMRRGEQKGPMRVFRDFDEARRWATSDAG